MAFFKSLLKKDPPAPVPEAPASLDFPELYSGMTVEVLTPTNVLIFVGKLRVLGNETLEVRKADGGFLPRAIYNQQVKLQGIQKNGQSFTINGAVGPNAPHFWRIERLRTLQRYENRNFFRQPIGCDGWVYPTIASSQGQRFPCKVLDISGGGARVVTSKLFQLDVSFQLEVSLLPEEEPFTLTCKVKRILPHSKPGSPGRKFEYGCQFTDVPPRERDRLVQAVFTLQRKTIRAQQS